MLLHSNVDLSVLAFPARARWTPILGGDDGPIQDRIHWQGYDVDGLPNEVGVYALIDPMGRCYVGGAWGAGGLASRVPQSLRVNLSSGVAWVVTVTSNLSRPFSQDQVRFAEALAIQEVRERLSTTNNKPEPLPELAHGLEGHAIDAARALVAGLEQFHPLPHRGAALDREVCIRLGVPVHRAFLTRLCAMLAPGGDAPQTPHDTTARNIAGRQDQKVPLMPVAYQIERGVYAPVPWAVSKHAVSGGQVNSPWHSGLRRRNRRQR